MKPEQLSHRIGNIDDKLIEQAEETTSFTHGWYNNNIRRMASVAAVMLLMAGSFVAGAFALAGEPEVVYVEGEPEIVYIEKEQELVEVGDSGISLILPDSWKGKYEYSYKPINRFNSYLEVNHTATGALLFWIERDEGKFTMDLPFPERGFTIAITENYTYFFCKPWWDVTDMNNINNPWLAGQTGIDDPIAWAEYEKMRTVINRIDVVIATEMLANSINATNWAAGTVVISGSIVNNWNNEIAEAEDVVCDEEQSRIIREIIGSRDYRDNGPTIRPPDYQYDTEPRRQDPSMYITFNGDEYFLNISSGSINKLKRITDGNYFMYGGDLSAAELNTITNLLNN